MGRSFRGIVVPGRGFGVPSMSKDSVLQAIRLVTGIAIIPCTLNLRLVSSTSLPLKSYVTEEELGGSVWKDHVPNRKGVR